MLAIVEIKNIPGTPELSPTDINLVTGIPIKIVIITRFCHVENSFRAMNAYINPKQKIVCTARPE